jgi:ferredoxin
MESNPLPVGSYVRLDKQDLQAIIDQLKLLGYRTIGPQVSDDAIIYDDLDEIRDLPIGIVEDQERGQYRLRRNGERRYFDHTTGPHSLKNFLFPPCETVLTVTRTDGHWKFDESVRDERPLAVLGARACDLQALIIQDHVFMQGKYVDSAYRRRRDKLFLVAVNCHRAAATCFCHSMKAGPGLQSGFDLGISELDEYLLIEVGSERGGSVVTAARWAPCSLDDIQAARDIPQRLSAQMRDRAAAEPADSSGSPPARSLDTSGLQELLQDNLEHPHWEDVARRCMACGNCTAVCPTCFCAVVQDASDLTGAEIRRERSWASCFTAEHSYMNSGPVRRTTESRYRQWLTHKLATWHDQFGSSGCVGCGRCITWCPVGIDLTQEVATLRGESQ